MLDGNLGTRQALSTQFQAKEDRPVSRRRRSCGTMCAMPSTTPILVARRHIDFGRVASAMCSCRCA